MSNESSKWHNTILPARLFWKIDAKVAVFIPMFLLHIRFWTFALMMIAIIGSCIMSTYGYTLKTTKLRLRHFIAGSKRKKWTEHEFYTRSTLKGREII